jgi:hypothetical protein
MLIGVHFRERVRNLASRPSSEGTGRVSESSEMSDCPNACGFFGCLPDVILRRISQSGPLSPRDTTVFPSITSTSHFQLFLSVSDVFAIIIRSPSIMLVIFPSSETEPVKSNRR